MDIGAIQLHGTETIMLFGGFIDNIKRNVHFYETHDEGRFEKTEAELKTGDYF